MFVNVYRPILSRHLSERCITFVCFGVKHCADLVNIVLLRWHIMVYSVMVMTLQKYSWSFILPVSLAIVYINRVMIFVNYVKIGRGGASPLVVPGRRKLLFFFFLSRSVPTFYSNCCSLYCRRGAQLVITGAVLKVLLISLKFDSGCSDYGPDAVRFSKVVYCDRFFFTFFFFCQTFPKKALFHGSSRHLARTRIYRNVYIKRT